VSEAAQGRRPDRAVVKTTVIFFAVGPLVGALTVVLISIFFSRVPQAGIYGFGYTLIFAIPIGYVFGGPAAALSGVIVSIASHRIKRSRWLYPFAAAVGGACAGGFTFTIETLRTTPPGSVKQSPWLAATMITVAGSVAAVVCTWLSKGAYVYRSTAELELENSGGGQ
jgi:hypothetical protein